MALGMDLRRDFILNCESPTMRSLNTDDRSVHRLVEHVYHITESLVGHLTHLVIAGGYAAYLEGVTDRYTDIDLFLVGTKDHRLEDVKDILRNCLAPTLGGVFGINLFSSRPVVAEITIYSSEVQISIMLTPTVFLDGNPSPDWITSAVGLLSSFDLGVSMCCLWKSSTTVLRTWYVDMFSRDTGRPDKRMSRVVKYRQRLKRYGSPPKLMVLACYAVGLETVGFPMDRLLQLLPS